MPSWKRIFSKFKCENESPSYSRETDPPNSSDIVGADRAPLAVDPEPDNADSMSASCPTRYVVLDLETTGLSSECDHIIEFGAIKVENGQEIDCFTTYINPGCPIPPHITQITGITDADVADAPSLDCAIVSISKFIGDLPVVVHNASFDLRFLCRAYQNANLQPRFRYIDTLKLARCAYPFAPNHQLSTLIDYLGIGGKQEHRALSDVRFTHQIFCSCTELLDLMDFSEIAISFPSTKYQRQKQSRYYDKCALYALTPQKPVTDPNHPFYQKSIVFTGTLKIPRQQAAQMAVDKGAVLKGSVSKRTNYLVVGEQDLALVGDDGMSSKEKKALQLNNSGDACIHILREDEFLRILNTHSGV